jgi:putative transposase
LRFGAYQESRLSRVKGQADLVYRNGQFYLYATVEMPTPPPVEPVGVLGVDMGIVELATDSEGNAYSGEAVKSCRRRLKEHRRHLQRRQTNSAKKRLQKLSGRQTRYIRNVNHCISKALVQTACASQKAIALESLEGIRARASVLGKEMRWLLGNWSFHQLRRYITYKAEAAGIPVYTVDPRNTSRTCSQCGHCDKANRTSQAHFQCLSCGFDANADFNAALNIEARAARQHGLLSSVCAPA